MSKEIYQLIHIYLDDNEHMKFKMSLHDTELECLELAYRIKTNLSEKYVLILILKTCGTKYETIVKLESNKYYLLYYFIIIY
jgi:hypothetical protein